MCQTRQQTSGLALAADLKWRMHCSVYSHRTSVLTRPQIYMQKHRSTVTHTHAQTHCADPKWHTQTHILSHFLIWAALIYVGCTVILAVIIFSKQINLSSAFTAILVSLNASQIGTAYPPAIHLPSLQSHETTCTITHTWARMYHNTHTYLSARVDTTYYTLLCMHRAK